MTPRQTRRSVLKTGAAVGGLAVTGSLAGCSDLLGGGGPGYTNWLYAPGAPGDGGNGNESQDGNGGAEENHYFFTFINDSKVRANEDNFDEDYNESDQIGGYPLEQMGIDDYDDIDSRVTIGIGGTTVVEGSFSQDDVVGQLESNEFEADGEYSGYAIYTGSSGFGGSQAIAIDGGTAVSAQGSGFSQAPEPRASIEAVIDADQGEEDRYVDVNEDMEVLTDELGNGVVILGSTQAEAEESNVANGTFAGQVAGGQVAEINGDTTTQTYVLVFADSDDVDTGQVEEWTTTANQTFQMVSDVSVSASGRVVTVTGEGETVDAFGGSA